MEGFILAVFILGYLAITLEHNLKVDKLIPALLMMALAWAGVAFGLDSFTTWFDSDNHHLVDGFAQLAAHSEDHNEVTKMTWMEGTLLHHFGKTCEILIFLIGAMTIVEIIDHFNGFATIKNFIKTNKKRTLLWIVCILAFVLSAIIDNLTATIVLITILRKLLKNNSDRIWYAGLIIIAANAGGAWSPIGDVTTTMLWMGERVSTGKLIEFLIIPSLVCMVLPTVIASFLPAFKGQFEVPEEEEANNARGPLMLYLGLGMIIFVPVFKTITHLPPYVGMMLSLSIVAMVAEVVSNRQLNLTSASKEIEQEESGDHNPDAGHHSSPTFKALGKIEMPSILFFLGILMTVAALESLGMIYIFGKNVEESMPVDLFITLMGVGSAVIDNVPLVAASMGMFDMTNPEYAMDSHIWHFIAYSAGTGGSMLIIGSAAGVVAMGMEKISFFWYLKNIAWLALIGFLAGAGVYLGIQMFV
ncbi:sodium/proton antiporter, NhaD family [Lishizhenia tianjinensis]|uniref:Sodium/proton antiporter, NhaD family n=1 Tax=Lishizhenia tianjinensis TaxID=477690 RepID=A0A1I7ALN9_9FLAO|nr:sodium:proton antiporter NhaD [Lishizhenia tianjinensis]SFT75869.1 sodium/proton antiporter, NhaD family [Lishizhenia tianjinensis]